MLPFLRCLFSLLLLTGIVVLAGVNGWSAPGEVHSPGRTDLPMNLFIEINCDLASAAAYESRTSQDPVDEIILGSPVKGHAITFAVSGAEFLPDDEKASLELVVNGKSDSKTVATQGPVSAFNTNVTTFQARKPVSITAEGICWKPAYVGIRIDSELDCIEVKPKGAIGAIMRKLAYVLYERDKDKAREEGEYKGGVKLLEQLDKEADPELAKQNKEFHKQFRQPLEAKNLMGKPFLFRTTKELLIAMTRLVEEDQPPTILPPPKPEGLPAMTVRIHESLFNTAASRLYAGQTRDREGFLKDMKDLGLIDSDEAQKEKKDKKDEDDFEITFAKKDPITATFADQRVKVTIRNTRFKREGTVYERPWQTTLTFRLSKEDKAFRLDREGDIDPVPLDPATMQPTEMSGPRIVERRALIRLIRREMEDEYILDEIKPTGDLKKIGTLEADQGTSINGWLLLAWKRNPKGQ